MTIADALERAGMSRSEAAAKEERFSRVRAVLDQRAAHAQHRAWFVPGRIEVLGKHTDYGGGRTLVCAAERGFCVIAAPRADDRVTVSDATRASTLTTTLGGDVEAGEHRWFNYPATVIRRLARNFPSARRGADIVFESDLPSASGMSSSSALMIGVLLALADINMLRQDGAWRDHIRTDEDLASYAATIENGRTFGRLEGDSGVGTAGGSEDHTAILCGRAGHLSQYAFCPVRFERTVPVAPGLVFAIGVSGIAANKTGDARAPYNSASTAVSEILARWRAATGRPDESLAAAVESGPDAPDRIRAIIREIGADAPRMLARFDQFVEESETLVRTAGDQLAHGDLAGFGRSVDRSQQLAESLLANQVPETIELARSARAHGAHAASAFGAGFGGSVWALVTADEAAAFLDRWSSSYSERFPAAAERAKFFVTRPGPAATMVAADESL
jgi:galactokinase